MGGGARLLASEAENMSFELCDVEAPHEPTDAAKYGLAEEPARKALEQVLA